MDEQNTSMEELKVEDDENGKDISLEEDILGTQSLLMSETDDEGDEPKKRTISPLKRKGPKIVDKAGREDKENNVSNMRDSSTRTTRIHDSDDEVHGASTNSAENVSPNTTIYKKITHPSDTDSKTTQGVDKAGREVKENNVSNTWDSSTRTTRIHDSDDEVHGASTNSAENVSPNTTIYKKITHPSETDSKTTQGVDKAGREVKENNVSNTWDSSKRTTRDDNFHEDSTNSAEKLGPNSTIYKKISHLTDADSETTQRVDKAGHEDNEKSVSETPQSCETLLEDDTYERIGSKKTKRILDSDDEDVPASINSEANLNANNITYQKIKKLVDTESESDVESVDHRSKEPLKLLVNVPDSEDDDIVKTSSDNVDIQRVLKVKKKIKSKNVKKKSVEVNNSKSDMILGNQASKKNKSSLIDSDSEPEPCEHTNCKEGEMELEESADNFDEYVNQTDSSKQKTKKIRASAKKAMDEMQAIQSEQQRLHREASISIPYHKPKKHTLQDFLNRRTIIKPSSENSPVADAGQRKSLKMTQEELEEYAKLMEERANEAKEFFKSESEDEEEVFKDNVGILARDSIDKKMTVTEDRQQEQSMSSISPEKEAKNVGGEHSTEEDLSGIMDNGKQEEPPTEELLVVPSTSKVLITEIIELPKLDMNTVKISPVEAFKPKKNIKEILNEIKKSGSPFLSGDPNKLIDLETGNFIEKRPTGVENLMKRLMATVKARKSKTSETCNILSTENGKLEMTTVNVSLKEEKDANKDPKPGAAYFALQKNLKDIIKKKRLEELHKKQEDEFEDSKCLEPEDDDEEVEEETEEYEPESKPKSMDALEIDEDENPVVYDDNDEEYDEKNENSISGLGIKEQAEDEEETDCVAEEESETEVDEEEDNDSNDNEENSSDDDRNCARNKINKRIIKAFDDSDEEVEKQYLDFLKPQETTPEERLICDSQSYEKNVENEENELISLCSGSFDAIPSISLSNALMSQIPVTQNQGKSIDDDILMGLCSGTFDEPAAESQSLPLQSLNSQHEENHQQQMNFKIVSTDEEELVGDNEIVKKRKKLSKTIKRKKAAKLGFSDDEEEDEPNKNELAIDLEEDSQEEAEEEPETFIDYDSEENEVVVQMTKEECVKRAGNFFEKEAELSESEWGSGDEDERNLDTYDIELGDEDEFDKDKLKSELEQIHARKMLDEDLREVRRIQEMLFDDEEKDGIGRQRQFKWKNAENGFSLEDSNREENGEGNGDSGDELNEHQWRKIRYEREQFLKEQAVNLDSPILSTALQNSPLLLGNNNNSMPSKKIQIITKKIVASSNASNYSGNSNPFLISKGIATMNKKSARGSFLVRDKDTLNKLAGFTKGTAGNTNTNNNNDTAGSVSIKGVKAQNFVFATLTEEEHQNLKRKSDDLLNSSNENGTNYIKKPKIEPRRDKCFIDQLL